MNENFDRLAFRPEEYLARRDALRAMMAERGIDVVVLTSTENTYYLTGFGSLAYGATALVMRSDGRAIWVMRRTELSNIRALADQLWVNEGIGIKDGDRVVTAGQNKIDQGSKVKIDNSIALRLQDTTTIQ